MDLPDYVLAAAGHRVGVEAHNWSNEVLINSSEVGSHILSFSCSVMGL